MYLHLLAVVPIPPHEDSPLLICTLFLKNQFRKIKFDELDFYCLYSLQKSISKLIFAV